MTEIGASEYPDVELSHMYVDNAAMQLIRNPKQVLLPPDLALDLTRPYRLGLVCPLLQVYMFGLNVISVRYRARTL